MRRFFLNREAVLSARPTLTGPDVHHIRTVLRSRPGDELVVFDGTGFEYRVRIEAVSAEGVRLCVLERRPSVSESPLAITLGLGILKSNKMDRLIRQATELGVQAIIPVHSKRSVGRLDEGRWEQKKERWSNIARESLKQCNRSRIPQMVPPLAFNQLVATRGRYDLAIVFHRGVCSSSTSRALLGAASPAAVLAVIGPEGGFSHEEIQEALQGGFLTLSLGPRILKADTAVVAACTILQHHFGDMTAASQ